jgi:hypothetical protein
MSRGSGDRQADAASSQENKVSRNDRPAEQETPAQHANRDISEPQWHGFVNMASEPAQAKGNWAREGLARDGSRGNHGVASHITPQQIASIQHDFPAYHAYFQPEWYNHHSGVWVAAGVAARAWWLRPAWNSAVGWFGGEDDPVTYDYGNNITYDDETIYYDDQPAASAETYYDQAVELAGSFADDSRNEEWFPLGAFAVVNEGQAKPDKILQIAVNKQGAVRGNLFDRWTDKVVAVSGAVDKTNQRVAFRMEGNDAVVAECGLWNLTQETTPLMIHFGPQHMEQRLLVRLAEPESQNTQETSP